MKIVGKEINNNLFIFIIGTTIFSLVGWETTTGLLEISSHIRILVIYWIICLFFSSSLILELVSEFNTTNHTEAKDIWILLGKNIYHIVALFFSAVLIEGTFLLPTIIFLLCLLGWALWSILRRKTDEWKSLDYFVTFWIIGTAYYSLGLYFLGYSEPIHLILTAIHPYLDLRWILLGLIFLWVLFQSVSKATAIKIYIKDILVISNGEKRILLLLLKPFLLPINILLKFLWRLLLFLLEVGKELAKQIWAQTKLNFNTGIDALIVCISIVGFYICLSLANENFKYLSQLSYYESSISLIILATKLFIVVLCALTIAFLNNTIWSTPKFEIKFESYNKFQQDIITVLPVPLAMAWISGIILFGASSIKSLEIITYSRIGIVSSPESWPVKIRGKTLILNNQQDEKNTIHRVTDCDYSQAA